MSSPSTDEAQATPEPPVEGDSSAAEAEDSDSSSPKPSGKPRYWTPHDPTASYGHKGLGYHVHLTERCRNAGSELLTDYGVVTAAQSDVGQAPTVVERLQQRGHAPTTLYADGGYPTPADLLALPQQGLELCAPVHRGPMGSQVLTRQDFEQDEQGQVLRCPQGHAPTRHGLRASSDTASARRSLHVFFDADTCRACPLLEQCPVRTPNHKKAREYRMDLAPELRARDRRFREQQSEAWQLRYQIRCGIEATMSEMKRSHGLGRLRVRGLVRVLIQVALKATACNIKRWVRALQGLGAKAPGSGQPGGAPERFPGAPGRLFGWVAAATAIFVRMGRRSRLSPVRGWSDLLLAA